MNTKNNLDFDKFLDSVSLDTEESEKERIVYGVNDQEERGFFQKINDYFINISRVSVEEKAYFFHLLAVMLDAGMPILKALKVLAIRTSNRKFKRVINTLIYYVEQGKKLSDSMQHFPDIFSESEVGIVKSGEAVGHLDQMLFKLSNQLEKDKMLSQKLVNVLWYPAMVLTVMFIVSSIIIIFVIPTLKNLFESSGVKLPFFTRVFIGVSDFVTMYWWLLILIFIALYAIFTAYIHSEYGRFKWDYTKLVFPIVGELVRKSIISRFVLLLSVLVESGLPINRSLEIISEALSNDVYRRKLLLVKEKVEAGEKISTNLKDASLLFPDTVVNMLNIGEGAASIGVVADKLATHYMTEVDSSIKKLTTVFEPIVLLIVAVLVAVLAVSVLLPLFSFGDLIAQ